MLFRRDTATLRERAQLALASIQRNAYAMSVLRARLESRVGASNGDSRQELERVLELVKNGEVILNEMSGKMEAAKYLEEFITIIDSAAGSVGEIRDDIEKMVPIAESALAEIHEAVAKISGGEYPGAPPTSQELQKLIMEEAENAAKAAEAKMPVPPAAEAAAEPEQEREAEPA
ncbi:hypothetical protein [Nitrososphaera sp.]|uniref:hypothetical protein n=1 Tax=Nitrososphaera sp. TaxID=1971748 RepID=UPI0018022AD8|nr:hypothetical protein [Nitrososphaera sp.]NWG37504.1 hypothetical protein [Nitrososphaera sp.]